MTDVKIRWGTARRLGLRLPPRLLMFPRDVSPEAVEEFIRHFEERLATARFPVRLFPPVESGDTDDCH